MTVIESVAEKSAPPAAWSTNLVTRSRFIFHVRPATPDDAAALAGLLAHVTPDDLRFRFLTAVNRAGPQVLARMTAVDHDLTEDFLGFDGNLLIATAMIAADAALDRAEVAIAIHRDYKNRGIGWALLEHAALYAESKGIKTLESIESRANHDVIQIEREMGFTIKACPGDESLVLLEKRFGEA